jgi:hypothetical protein
MLIVNSKVLNNNTQDPDLKSFDKEYQQGVADLRAKFPSGQIQLQRNGYPAINKSHDPNYPDMPEIAPPLYVKLSKMDSAGVVWSYCKGRPRILANGLAEVPEDQNSEELSGEVITLDLRNKPDYAFYFMYKSGLLKSHFHVHDPEGDRIKELEQKNAKIKVQYLIREGMDEAKLRTVSSAWGIPDAGKMNVLLLQDALEGKVFAMEEQKRKNPTDLSLRGVHEFIAEVKTDEVTRPKALIQLAIDDKRLIFSPSDSSYYFDGAKVCYVNTMGSKTKEDSIADFLRDERNKGKWQEMLRALVTEEYLNSLDKVGVRWLAAQMDIALNQKEPELRKALLEAFKPE